MLKYSEKRGDKNTF
ncbi:hypothetical protein RDI58_005739 [Solanum bulbocastanum]|uniref:Uncharacterized protein n=1 Tax=Solanum bulbocastanum TaxID=147425 RepID=A0AAN8U8V7_SOLBU